MVISDVKKDMVVQTNSGIGTVLGVKSGWVNVEIGTEKGYEVVKSRAKALQMVETGNSEGIDIAKEEVINVDMSEVNTNAWEINNDPIVADLDIDGTNIDSEAKECISDADEVIDGGKYTKPKPKRKRNVEDEFSKAVVGMDMDDIYSFVADTIQGALVEVRWPKRMNADKKNIISQADGDIFSALKTMYGHLNPGMQRMNLGNIFRGVKSRMNK